MSGYPEDDDLHDERLLPDGDVLSTEIDEKPLLDPVKDGVLNDEVIEILIAPEKTSTFTTFALFMVIFFSFFFRLLLTQHLGFCRRATLDQGYLGCPERTWLGALYQQRF